MVKGCPTELLDSLNLFDPHLLVVLYLFKNHNPVLAGVAQWIEHWTAKQRVPGLIPSQGTCLGCWSGP